MRRLVLFLVFPLCALSSTTTENSFRDRRQGTVHFMYFTLSLSSRTCLLRLHFVTWDMQTVIITGIILSTEDLAKSLQEYEVIAPQVITETGSFLSNEFKDAIGNERVYIRFRAFGEEFLLDLRKNRKLVDPKFTSEILDNSHQPPRVNLSRNCYYIGSLRFRPKSSVALSGCHGLVRADNVSLFISRGRFCLQTVFMS